MTQPSIHFKRNDEPIITIIKIPSAKDTTPAQMSVYSSRKAVVWFLGRYLEDLHHLSHLVQYFCKA